MPVTTKDIVPFSQVRARLTELAEEVVTTGHEKIFTRNGEGYVALIDAHRLDYYHQLEREHINSTLLNEAEKGLEDVLKENMTTVAKLQKKYKRKQ